MKNILFLQNKGNIIGGVWLVNKTLGEEFQRRGYNVSIVSLRNDKNNESKEEYNHQMNVFTINPIEKWGTYNGSNIISDLKEKRPISAIKKYLERKKYYYSLARDGKELTDYINTFKPNYIIVSHYQLLNYIPKNYYKKTINVQHSSFLDAMNNRDTKNTFYKYNNKIKYVWLTKNTCSLANKNGFINSSYIYNPVRFNTPLISNVIKNKKLVNISRLANDKRSILMVEMVIDIFKNEKYHDWVFEIYGNGSLKSEIEKLIENNKQIKLMGVTNNPKEVLLTSSINLNTSPYEGFSLSILEANECGVPTVSFSFGESVNEEIINNVTGVIIENDDCICYKNKLMSLMDNKDKLELMSKNCKEFSQKFNINSIIKEWIDLFTEIDEKQE